MRAQVYKLRRHFQGLPRPTDVEIIQEAEYPPLKEGQFLVEAQYYSLDSYMSRLINRHPIGHTFYCDQIARVIESENSDFEEGDYILGLCYGMRSRTICDGTFIFPDGQIHDRPITTRKITPSPNIPLTAHLGVLGKPGVTAYYGLLDILQIQPGERLVISGAGGGIGTVAGQIAKTIGCKVIGVTSSELKGQRLVTELHLDGYVNYRSANFQSDLEAVVPNEFDCYFDCVGGQVSSLILQRMRTSGRIAANMSLDTYNEPPYGDVIQRVRSEKNLTLRCFEVEECGAYEWQQAINQIKVWINATRFDPKETIIQGFNNMFIRGFTDMVQGNHFGKTIVRA